MRKSKKNNFLVFALIIFTFLIIFYAMKSLWHVHAYPEGKKYTIVDTKKQVPGEDKDSENLMGDTVSTDYLIEDTVMLSSDSGNAEEEAGNDSSFISENNTDPSFKEEEKPESGYFKNLIDKYQDEVLSDFGPKENRTDIVVRYYQHEADNNKVETLSSYGFYLHKRPVEDNFQNYSSNALFYGDSVSKRDIQLIAYILLKNGVLLKSIQESKFHDSWKAKAVEIGTDTTLLEAPVLTEKDIQSFKK